MTQRLARVLVALLADRVVDARAETLTTKPKKTPRMCVHDRTNGHFDRDHRHQAGQAVVRLREAQELREAQAREAAQGHEADLAATQIGGLNQVEEGGWSVARRVDPCPLKSAYLPVETALHL